MIIVTTESVPGREIAETLGVVRGNTIRARHLGHDVVAGLKGLVGGEIHDYTKLMGEAREQAMDRMSQQAAAMGADAVVNVRLGTSMIMQMAAEIVAYGTAVKLR
ncbi:MAG: heavy metal-binding domain-containing protein [Candidatus Eisenbacteria bacterium]|nr:heavy metal-binding domain-containing protein [Candidatus Eisenbacteria bacterium]